MQKVLLWFGTLGSFILTLGYPGVLIALIVEALGLPFPGDAFLTFYGFAAAEGKMNLFFLLLISTIGFVIGSTIAFILSVQFGEAFLKMLERLHLLNAANMKRTANLMDKYGAILLIPGRFLPGIRSLSSYAAGACRMALSRFLVYTTIGAILWCSMWILLGYWFGENMKLLLHTVQSSLLYVSLGIVVLFAFLWLVRRVSNHF